MSAIPFSPQLRRRTFLLAGLFLMSAVTIAYFSNLISYRHSHRWDMTQSKRFTLDPRTVAALQRIEQKLPPGQQIDVITCFAPQASTRPGERILVSRISARAKFAIDLFTKHCPRINAVAYDPYQNKTEMEELVRRFGGADLADTIVVITGPPEGAGSGSGISGHEFIKRHQLADLNFKSRSVTRWKTETALIQALQQVAGERAPHFYVTTGSGEAELSQMTALQALFAPGNVKMTTLPIAAPLPTTADSLVIVAAPRGDLSPARAAQLGRYLRGGGRALLIVPPIGVARPLLAGILEPLGCTIPGKVVVGDRRMEFLVTHTGIDHAITGDLPAQQRVFLRSVQSFERAALTQPLHTFTPLITTRGATEWGHVPDRRGQRHQVERDKRYHLAAAMTWPAQDSDGKPLAKGGTGRLVLIGSASILENQLIERAGIANRSLIYNSAMWLINPDASDQLLGNTHTGRENREIQLDDEQKRQFVLLLVLTPTVAFFAGILVWLFRKD